MTRQYDITVAYEIKKTKKDAITKKSMKDAFKTCYELSKEKKAAEFDAFIKDATGATYCFTFSKGGNYQDFTLSCELTEDETSDGSDVYTVLSVSWLNGQHRAFDWEYADYEVERA